MKRLLSCILTLAMALSVVLTPALATEATTALPAVDVALAASAEGFGTYAYGEDYQYEYDFEYNESDYWTGNRAGYDVGYEEGLADCARDMAAGTGFNPKHHYRVFTKEEAGFVTYDDGYTNGLKYGYWRAYYDTFYQEVYDAGYAEGYALGQKDAAVEDDYANEPEYPYDDPERYDDKEYKRVCGLYDGYNDAINDSWEAEWEAEQQAAYNEKLTSLGGVPGQINVRLNEKMIAFPDAVPEFLNDRTMIPVRALMESVDAEVTWQDPMVSISREGFLLEIKIGSEIAKLTENGETRDLTLDAPAYLKDSRCFVPLRLIGEALGYDVYWDDDYQTVVILDKAGIIDGIDSKFTAFNAYFKANKRDLNQRAKMTMKVDFAVEMLDSIDGSKTYAFPLRMDAHFGDGGLVMQGSVDLTKLKELAAPYVAQYSYYLADESTDTMMSLIAQKQEFSCRLTPEGVLCFKMPLIDKLQGYYLDEAPAGTDNWYRLDLNKLYPEWRTLLELDSLGSAAYTTAMMDMGYASPIDYFDNIQTMSGAYTDLLADENLKLSGGEYRMTLDLDKLIEMSFEDAFYAEYYDEESLAVLKDEMRAMFDVFKIDLRFKKDGSYKLSAQIKMEPQVYLFSTKINMEMNGSGSPRDSKLDTLMQMKNQFNVTIRESVTMTDTQSAPDFALPAGATVIDLLGGAATDDPFEDFFSKAATKLVALLP